MKMDDYQDGIEKQTSSLPQEGSDATVDKAKLEQLPYMTSFNNTVQHSIKLVSKSK